MIGIKLTGVDQYTDIPKKDAKKSVKRHIRRINKKAKKKFSRRFHKMEFCQIIWMPIVAGLVFYAEFENHAYFCLKSNLARF